MQVCTHMQACTHKQGQGEHSFGLSFFSVKLKSLERNSPLGITSLGLLWRTGRNKKESLYYMVKATLRLSYGSQQPSSPKC